jgi:hypothetical protein
MGRALAEHDPASGLNSLDSLASYDPESCSWKTSQRYLEGGFCEFSETLPRSGMMRSGALYPLPNVERRIEESDSLSWPTPNANECGPKINSTNSKTQIGLRGAIARQWPTPGASMGTGGCTGPSRETKHATLNHSVGTGSLNPGWVESLMGFPDGWTDGLPRPEKTSMNGSNREQSQSAPIDPID